jgi:hypothetical protein
MAIRWALSGAVCAILAGSGAAAAAETLHVTLDKSSLLRLGEPAATVLVGSPEIADVTVESPKLLVLVGRKTGETSLILLNRKGDQIASYNLLVVPEDDRHVTVHRGAEGVATFSCDPRCVGVKNPGLEGAEEKGGAKGGPGGKPATATEAIEQLGTPKQPPKAEAAPPAPAAPKAPPSPAGGMKY